MVLVLFIYSTLMSADTLFFNISVDKLMLLPSNKKNYVIEKGKEFVKIQENNAIAKFYIEPQKKVFKNFKGTITSDSTRKIEVIMRIPNGKYVNMNIFMNSKVYIKGLNFENLDIHGKLFKVLNIENTTASIRIRGWGDTIKVRNHKGNLTLKSLSGGGNIFISSLEGNIFFQPYVANEVHFQKIKGNIQGQIITSQIFIEEGEGKIYLKTPFITPYKIRGWEGQIDILPK